MPLLSTLPVWGTGGREFKSPRSDQCFQRDSGRDEGRKRPANVKHRTQKCKTRRGSQGVPTGASDRAFGALLIGSAQPLPSIDQITEDGLRSSNDSEAPPPGPARSGRHHRETCCPLATELLQGRHHCGHRLAQSATGEWSRGSRQRFACPG
jgi:hypothetical protein